MYSSGYEMANLIKCDIDMSVHRNVIPNYNQQDATFLYLFMYWVYKQNLYKS